MKKILFVLLLVLFPLVSFAQMPTEHPMSDTEWYTITLDSTCTGRLYILFSPLRGYEYSMSETLPTATTVQIEERKSTGNVTICVVTDSLTNQESDSVYFYKKPLAYIHQKGACYTPSNDSTFLVFDTKDTYTSSSADYLNWTHGKMYICTLNGELLNTTGFVLYIKQFAFDEPGAASKFYVQIWKEK